jgi:hypothetical protein
VRRHHGAEGPSSHVNGCRDRARDSSYTRAPRARRLEARINGHDSQRFIPRITSEAESGRDAALADAANHCMAAARAAAVATTAALRKDVTFPDEYATTLNSSSACRPASDSDNAAAVARTIRRGYTTRWLSHDAGDGAHSGVPRAATPSQFVTDGSTRATVFRPLVARTYHDARR